MVGTIYSVPADGLERCDIPKLGVTIIVIGGLLRTIRDFHVKVRSCSLLGEGKSLVLIAYTSREEYWKIL